MQKVLSKRILRDLKANFFRYFSLFFMIVLGMYMIVSIVGAAESVIVRVGEASRKNSLEDGEFTVFVPLEEKNINTLKKKGITLEKEFYLDYIQGDQSTLRIYKSRSSINKIELDQGSLAKKDNEIVLEKHYAAKHRLTVGSTIVIAGRDYQVCGTGSVPDYDAPFKTLSDSSVESNIFGLGFVTDSCYVSLKKENKASKTEEYVYSYLLNSSMTQRELKDYLGSIQVDKTKVSDTYFIQMLNELEKTKQKLKGGAGELTDGTKKLNQGLHKLTDNNQDILDYTDAIYKQLLSDATDKLSEAGLQVILTEDNYKMELEAIRKQVRSTKPELAAGMKALREELDGYAKFERAIKEYLEAAQTAADGSADLSGGAGKLQKNIDRLVNQYLSVDIDNLTQFVERKDNPRIAASVNDVQINKSSGMVSGIIVIALFTYVISVFVIHGIEQENEVIGALYALGVTKKQVTRHYLMLPVLIALAGGTIGTVIGFSPLGVNYQLRNSTNYFSLPVIHTVYPAYLLLYGIVIPPLIAAVVNYFAINKKLSRPALKMLRNEQKQNRISMVKLGKLAFLPRFQIRQFLREMRSSITVAIGMFIALLVMMIGVNCYVLCHNVSVQNKEDTKYNYMYTYKYPTSEAPKGAAVCYIESLKKKAFGYDLDVTLFGIGKDNPYFNFHVSKGKNRIAISTSTAEKFGLSVGDKLVLSDTANDMDYAFTIDRIVPYTVGLSVFMNIDSMRELFGREDNYYNAALSKQALNIDSGRLYSVTTKEDISKNADVFVNSMSSLIISMVGISVIIFMVVMYLMMKVMIERSSFHISLFKIMGFRDREIRRLYLDGNFITVAVAAAIAVPLAKKVIDIIYPYFVSNVAVGMKLAFTAKMYAGIYIGILVCYLVINFLLVFNLKKVVPAQVLKNRE